MIAINKTTGKEYEVLDHHPKKHIVDDIYSEELIQIKKTSKSKPVWHTLRDYYIKEK